MKNATLIILLLLCSISLSGQGVIGSWNGILEVGGTKLQLLFHIEKKNTQVYSGTMDSPDQAAKGIPVSKVTVDGNKIEIEISEAQILYSGTIAGNEIIGKFKQAGFEIPLNMKRLSTKELEANAAKIIRPQEPKAPFPYYTEEVEFENKTAGITLAGTLTIPNKEGKFPVAILISGSGPQNRDEELMGHKPFLVLADYLTRQGIAVLRYDDRGVGNSKGNFDTATSLDFALDVTSAMDYLKNRKEINTKQIGLIGHSEGGLIAPIVATNRQDVAWMVLLAAPGVRGDELLLVQQETIAKLQGASEPQINILLENNRKLFDQLLETKDLELLKKQLLDEVRAQLPADASINGFHTKQIEQMTSPWMHYFICYNPAPTLEKIKCPVLALNGDKDIQVNAVQNLTAIENALKKGGNKQIKLITYNGLNHLFQECITGDIKEYSKIEQTISPKVLNEISSWIANFCR